MFQSFYDFPLANTSTTSTEICISMDDRYKFLLISDCHTYEKDLNVWFDELKKVVEKEKPTNIIILGDLIDGSVPNGVAAMGQALLLLKTFPFEVYVIGGNHDREFVSKISWPDDTNVHLIDTWSILFQLPQANVNHPLRIFLAHDLGNNYRVRDRIAFQFFEWIKGGSNGIKNPDWLICGHAHTSIVSRDSKIVCIGQFSPMNNKKAYTLLSIDQGKPSITCKVMLD